MMVTIGGRGTGAPSSSGRSNRPSSTSDSATRLTEWPISSAMSCAVSASSTSVSVTMRPWRIRSLMTSTARSDMRLASSWMVIASGSTISRAIFSFWSCAPWPFSRWVRRRNEATERVRSSSAEVALATVRRPRLRCSPPRGGRGVGTRTFCGSMGVSAGRRTTRAAPPLRRLARASAPAGGAAAAVGALRGTDGDGAGSPPARRRRASSSRLALEIGLLGAAQLFLALARLGGLALDALARLALAARLRRPPPGGGGPPPRAPARRGARGRAPRAARRSASAGRRRSWAAAARRASRARRGGRAARPEWAWPADGGFAAELAARRTARARRDAGVSPGARTRRFTFSTTTALLRPCEKLWRTVPCSTGRFRCKVAFGGGRPADLSLLFVSFMPIPNRLAFQPISSGLPGVRGAHRPARRRVLSWWSRPLRSRDNGANAPPSRERPSSPLQI